MHCKRDRRHVDDILHRTAARKIVGGLSADPEESAQRLSLPPDVSVSLYAIFPELQIRKDQRIGLPLNRACRRLRSRRSPEPGPRPPAVLRRRSSSGARAFTVATASRIRSRRWMFGAALGRKRKKCHARFGFQKDSRISCRIQRDVRQLSYRGHRNHGAIGKYESRFAAEPSGRNSTPPRIRGEDRCSELPLERYRLLSLRLRRRNRPHRRREPLPPQSTSGFCSRVLRFHFRYAARFPLREEQAGIVLLLPIFRRLCNLDPGQVHSRGLCGCAFDGSGEPTRIGFAILASAIVASGTQNSRIRAFGIHNPFSGCWLPVREAGSAGQFA